MQSIKLTRRRDSVFRYPSLELLYVQKHPERLKLWAQKSSNVIVDNFDTLEQTLLF